MTSTTMVAITEMHETDHTSWMLTSLLLWLCALPLVGLAILPWLGMKAAVIVAAVLLFASVTACYGICTWQSLGSKQESRK